MSKNAGAGSPPAPGLYVQEVDGMDIRRLFRRRVPVPEGYDVLRTGNAYTGRNGTYTRDGSVLRGTDGRTAYTVDGETFLPGVGMIRRCGNSWCGPKGVYTLLGDVLYGPGGKAWAPVRPADVTAVILASL